MSTKNTFEINSQPVIENAEELTLAAIKILKEVARRVSNDPDAVIRIKEEIDRLEAEINRYEINSREWVDENLSDAYRRGISSIGSGEVVTGFSILGLLNQGGGGGGEISDKAKRVLKEYPEHWTAYKVFQNDAYNAFNQSRLPIVRDTQDKIRDLIVQSSEASYREADTFTRRQMSQELMNRFADEGIEGVRYRNSRVMKIDSYAEMVARTQTKNAWNEASWNRMQQYGEDLIVISVHFPTSDLCAPYQGRVFSLSGTSPRYTSLEEAVNGGLFHVNCKHTSSQFTGETPPKPVSRERNREMYEAQVQQRQNERMIRKWKRRERGSITDAESQKARRKVREWQSKQRQHLENNKFLRRKYDREQV